MQYTIIVSEHVGMTGQLPAYAYPEIMCFFHDEVELFLKKWAALSFTEKDFVILLNGCVVDIAPIGDYTHYLTLLERMEKQYLPVVAEEFKNRR